MTGTAVDVVAYDHGPVKAPLLRAAVLPAMAAFPDGVRAHLERGWMHGPHLRVRLRGEAAEVDRSAAVMAGQVAAHQAARPPGPALSHAQLLELSTAAGRAELVPPPYEPFEPDGAVRLERPDSGASARVPGTPATAEVREELLRRGVPAVAAMVQELGCHDDSRGARVLAVVVALAAHAAVGPAGLAATQLSYRSHLEAHLHHHDADGRIRRTHAAVWAGNREEVTAVVAGQARPDGAGPVTARWWRQWGREARQVAAAAYDRGDLVSASGADTLRRARAFGDPALTRVYAGADISEFHRRLDAWELDGPARRRFEVERFCMNMLYLLLAVADVTPAERYLGGSLVCAAVEQLTGTTWQQQFDRRGW